ncbi:MAG: metallophosphoesterase, partial [Flavobacteriales bacterium]
MKFFLPILIFSLIFGLVQWMLYRSLTRLELSKLLKISILIFIILTYAFAVVQMMRVGPTSHAFTYYSAFFLLMFVPQLVHLLFGILSEFWIGGERLIFKDVNPSRRKFLAQLSLGLSALPFLGLLHGIFIGKYAFKRHRHELHFNNLPLAFDNYKIVHISDIHCGSLDDKSAIANAVELINAEEADLVLFTGDLVNHEAKEVDEWESILRNIQSKTGKYAVLGNHDYSPYSKTSAAEKRLELERVKAKYK